MLTDQRPATRTKSRNTDSGFLVWVIPVFALWTLVPGLHPIALMCAICVCLYLFLKTHTLLLFIRKQTVRPRALETLAWYAAWPGLNARHFFRSSPNRSPSRDNLVSAIAYFGLGAISLFAVAPQFRDSYPTLSGWCALTGIALMLHFGFFRTLALVWNRAGRPVVAIMNAPLKATSIADFWGNRWNLAFRDYAHLTIFSPLARRFNAVTGTLFGFLYSGIIHELAISVPAGGGYGLPTLYFAVQGVGFFVERWVDKFVLRIRGTASGWVWSVLWILVPAPFLLFHKSFIDAIVLPIVDAVG